MNLAKVDNPPHRCPQYNNLGEQCPFFVVEGEVGCHDEVYGFVGSSRPLDRRRRDEQGEQWIREVNLCRAYWGDPLIGDEKDQAWARPEEKEGRGDGMSKDEQGICMNCGAEMDFSPMHPWCTECDSDCPACIDGWMCYHDEGCIVDEAWMKT